MVAGAFASEQGGGTISVSYYAPSFSMLFLAKVSETLPGSQKLRVQGDRLED